MIKKKGLIFVKVSKYCCFKGKQKKQQYRKNNEKIECMKKIRTTKKQKK